MKHDRKADDKAATRRPTEEGGETPPAATETTEGATSMPRPGEPGYLSPLHAPTKR